METIIVAQVPRAGTFVANWRKYGVGLIRTSEPVLDSEHFPGQVAEADVDLYQDLDDAGIDRMVPFKKPKRLYGHMTVKPVGLLRHLVRISAAIGNKRLWWTRLQALAPLA